MVWGVVWLLVGVMPAGAAHESAESGGSASIRNEVDPNAFQSLLTPENDQVYRFPFNFVVDEVSNDMDSWYFHAWVSLDGFSDCDFGTEVTWSVSDRAGPTNQHEAHAFAACAAQVAGCSAITIAPPPPDRTEQKLVEARWITQGWFSGQVTYDSDWVQDHSSSVFAVWSYDASHPDCRPAGHM